MFHGFFGWQIQISPTGPTEIMWAKHMDYKAYRIATELQGTGVGTYILSTCSCTFLNVFKIYNVLHVIFYFLVLVHIFGRHHLGPWWP